jgi:hypothetical protein
MKSATTALLAFAALAFAAAAPIHATERPATVAEAASDAKPAKAEEHETQRPRTSQQEKMKTCNAEAKVKDLHGDERRAFMSTCLKG